MKNTLKKLFVIFFLVLTVLAFAACGKDEKDNKDEDDKKTEKSEKSDKDDDDEDDDDDEEDDDNNKEKDKDKEDDNNEDTPTEPVKEETTPEPTTEPTAAPTTEPTVAPTAEPTAAPTVEPTAEPTPEPTTAPDFNNGELTGVYKMISLYGRGKELVTEAEFERYDNAGVFFGSLDVKDDGTAVLRFSGKTTLINYDDTKFYDDTESMTYESSDTSVVLTSAENKTIATFVKMDAAELALFARIAPLDADQYAQLFEQVITDVNVVTPEPTSVPDNTDVNLADWEGSYKVVSVVTNGTETMNDIVLTLLEAKGLAVGIAEVKADGTVNVSLLGNEISGTFDGTNVTINGVTVPIVFEDGMIKLEQNGQSIKFKKMTPEEVGTLKAATTTELYSLLN